ncbi:MAG: radical SAM/SPASM domain-containing protein [Acidobacteriota bacterium]
MLELTDPARTFFYLRRAIRNRGASGLWNFLKTFVALRVEPSVVRTSPIAIQIEPVRACDLRCPYCAHPMLDRRKGMMPVEEFARVLKQFPFAIKLTLQGIGEPLLHRDFTELVRIAREQGLWVQTFTNGTRLAAQAQSLVASGIDRINISLDSVSQSVVDLVRPGARVEEIVEGMRLLVSAAKGLDRPEIHVYAVATRPALEGLERTIRAIAAAGVRRFHLQACHAFGSAAVEQRQGELGLEVTLPELQAAVATSRRVCKELGVSFRSSAAELVDMAQSKDGGRRHCQWPWYKAYVAYDGEMRFCCRNIQSGAMLSPGNIEGGWFRIWNGDKYRAFRRNLKSSVVPEHCKGCAAYYLEY